MFFFFLWVSVFVLCCCDKHHSQKHLWAGKGCFGSHLCCGPSPRQANLEAETEAETREESYLLGCFLWFSRCFFIQPMATCPVMVLSTVNWAQSYQSLMKKMTHRLASSLLEAGPWLRFFLLDDTIHVKLTKTHQQSGLGYFVVVFNMFCLSWENGEFSLQSGLFWNSLCKLYWPWTFHLVLPLPPECLEL